MPFGLQHSHGESMTIKVRRIEGMSEAESRRLTLVQSCSQMS